MIWIMIVLAWFALSLALAGPWHLVVKEVKQKR